jgi:uncharacterized protein
MLSKHYYPLIKIVQMWISRFTIVAIALTTGIYIYASKIEPNWIEVVPIQLAIPNLTPAFDQFKLVQISDIHISRFMTSERMDKIIRLVNQQQPDAIAITGDIITKYTYFDVEELVAKLSKLVSQECTIAVLGNHDHWGKETAILKDALVQSKVTNLDNQVYILERGTEKLTFAGIDDPYVGKPNLEQVIKQLPDDSPAILLVHEPDYIDKSAKTQKFALQLSGHSHGGQIRVPFLTPLVLPPGGRKYFVGLNQVDQTIEYTNRGLGMTGIPFRLNSRPEITVFTLKTVNH